ncbi:MAG: S46 family peptidase [Bacteroidetes bacterium]|nr:S46 family peptidase [Bacteroidota bacterium]HET6243363.1 S46 family peptidase [Bacteroidia bacterium]
MKIKIYHLLLFIFTINISAIKADEGMWLPLLLKQLNESDMQSRGLKLSAEDLYSINRSSLKDAIVHFGGGCTGELISPEGLMLTNHHCGYSQIQSHSSVKNDYLTNGFWAKSRAEELANPGLTATFIISMEDVTQKVLKGVLTNMSESLRDSLIAQNSRSIEKEAVLGTHFEAKIKPFYNGNEFYMYITETFRDVRLVGAPPSSIGKFGGDTDNWMWPRHTGDFSVFRIYANKENKPADYSTENVPFIPRHFFPVSLKGVEQGDFTMVYGFPGRTNQYLTSYAVDNIMHVSNPAKIKIRTTRLDIWDKEMKKSDEVRIQYAAKYASVSNYHKKWIGENRGLKKLNAIEAKRNFETKFTDRLAENPDHATKYGSLLKDFKVLYDQLDKIQKPYDYFGEAVMAVEIIKLANTFMAIAESANNPAKTKDEYLQQLENLRAIGKGHFKNYNAVTDQKIFTALLEMYQKDVNASNHPEIFKTIDKKFKGDFNKYAQFVFDGSVMSSAEKINKFIDAQEASVKKNGTFTKEMAKTISRDPAYELMISFIKNYRLVILPEITRINNELNRLNRTYMQALREVIPEKKYYPDANSTLRVAYGKVDGYEPADGVEYIYYSTLSGIMEKENPEIDEFIVSDKLKELYKNKDFGQYADKNGELRVAFIASNHTTGGNSGSPVIDGNGYLIGTNFDRNWEGTMSDIMYDPERVRNISVDIRYTLFVIDKFAGAGYLLNEMKIIK